jgi:hypothetical protein
MCELFTHSRRLSSTMCDFVTYLHGTTLFNKLAFPKRAIIKNKSNHKFMHLSYLKRVPFVAFL